MEISPQLNLTLITSLGMRNAPDPEPAEVQRPAAVATKTVERTPVPQPEPLERAESPSPEEQAIRAAFQAQLPMSELLSVVRDPADVVLPDAPDLHEL